MLIAYSKFPQVHRCIATVLDIEIKKDVLVPGNRKGA